jgi:hypothetical protein
MKALREEGFYFCDSIKKGELAPSMVALYLTLFSTTAAEKYNLVV